MLRDGLLFIVFDGARGRLRALSSLSFHTGLPISIVSDAFTKAF